MNKSMKKNIRHFFLLTAFAAGTIHLVNRFIDFTASMKNILKTENGNFFGRMAKYITQDVVPGHLFY